MPLPKPTGLLVTVACALPSIGITEVSQEQLDAISTPNEVDTSIGVLKFIDGAPLPENSAMVYDYLDRARGVDAFLKGIPAASIYMLIEGVKPLGAVEAHQVGIFNESMYANPLILTGNSSTMDVFPNLVLERDGPTVVEVLPGALGAFNDAYFRYIGDVGPAGPDAGKGGKYLILPPGYDGDVPDGFLWFNHQVTRFGHSCACRSPTALRPPTKTFPTTCVFIR